MSLRKFQNMRPHIGDYRIFIPYAGSDMAGELEKRAA